MGRLIKQFTLMLISLLLISLFMFPCLLVNAQHDSKIIPKLSVRSPSNSTAYTQTMPLRFTIDWSINNASIPWIYVNFSYYVDDYPSVALSGGGELNFPASWSVIKTYINDEVDVSNFKGGLHTLTIQAYGSYNVNNNFVYGYNHTFEPIFFYVDYIPTSTPSAEPTISNTPTVNPSVPEFPITATLIAILAVVSLLLVIGKRKLTIEHMH